MEEQKFTIEEIKNYIMNQDSLGDVLYFLSADHILKANGFVDFEDDECDATESDIY